jgi:enoyl-[acyl-carrier protein] reductase I
MTLLSGKRLLITGVLTEASIAFATARIAQDQGAEVVLTGFGKGLRLTERVAGRLSPAPDVLEMDVTDDDQVAQVVAALEQRWGAVDGVVHAIGFAPASAIGGGFLQAPWQDVATAVQISTYSFASVARAFAPLLEAAGGGAYVGLDFDASVAWPSYDWMGVAKAGLEAACRYTARDLGGQGTRVNLVAAGPLKTMAARQIEGFTSFEDTWDERAPLGWDVTDATPVASVVCSLLSDWMPGVTGEIVHCDGGVHAIGV